MLQNVTRIEGRDCIQFIEQKNETSYLLILSEKGCWSHLGWQRVTSQVLSLEAPVCISKNKIAHELIHALGFDHEQSRPDRDKWIEIKYKNILEGN